LLMVVALLNKLLQNADTWVYILGMLAGNLLVGWVAILLSRRQVKTPRKEFAADRPVARPPESAPVTLIPDPGGD